MRRVSLRAGPKPFIGTALLFGLDKGLDEAKAKGWVVVDMKGDWKAIYAVRTN